MPGMLQTVEDDYCLSFCLLHRYVTDYSIHYSNYTSHVMELEEKQPAFYKTFKNVIVGAHFRQIGYVSENIQG